MTDSDLLMLENLTYITDNEFKEYDVTKPISQCQSVDEFLGQFDDETLSRMDNGDSGSQEWAARIRYMKQNPDISSLEIKEYNSQNKCILFEEPQNPGHAIVAFRGTSGGNEWKDNAEGLSRSDTEAQIRAKEYIESLEYEGITVTGHSKGGNKAMYVSITCDKVDRCVSYDGQGFSKEFLDKYAYEIEQRSQKIKNYSLENDYVNILMFPIPGAELIYMEKGNRVTFPGGAHYPYGPFNFKCVDGQWVIDTSGGLIRIPREQDPSMAMLHDFTAFFMNNASPEEIRQMSDFLGALLKGIMGSGDDKWTNDQIAEYLLNNKESAILFAAFLLKYMKENNIGFDDIVAMLGSFGMNEDDLWDILSQSFGGKLSKQTIKKLVKKAFEFLFDQMTDSNDDGFIKFVIGLIGGENGAKINEIWTKIEDKYNSISTSGGSDNYASKIRDYSLNVYNTVMRAITLFESASLPKANSWSVYSNESWFNKLLLGIAIKCINNYGDRLSKVNAECRTKVDQVFNEMNQIDQNYAKENDGQASQIRMLALRMNV